MNFEEVIELIEGFKVFKLTLAGKDLNCALVKIHGRDSDGDDYTVELGFLVDYFVVKDIAGKKLFEMDFNDDENRRILQLVKAVFKKIDLYKIEKHLKNRLERIE